LYSACPTCYTLDITIGSCSISLCSPAHKDYAEAHAYLASLGADASALAARFSESGAAHFPLAPLFVPSRADAARAELRALEGITTPTPGAATAADAEEDADEPPEELSACKGKRDKAGGVRQGGGVGR